MRREPPTEYAEYTRPDGARVLLHEQDAIIEGFCLACGCYDPRHTDTLTGLCPNCTSVLHHAQGRPPTEGDV